MTIKYAPDGIFYLRAYAKEDGAETCYSDIFKVEVLSHAHKLLIINDTD